MELTAKKFLESRKIEDEPMMNDINGGCVQLVVLLEEYHQAKMEEMKDKLHRKLLEQIVIEELEKL